MFCFKFIYMTVFFHFYRWCYLVSSQEKEINSGWLFQRWLYKNIQQQSSSGKLSSFGWLQLWPRFDMSEQSKLKIWMKSKPVILKSNPVATALPSDVIKGQRNLLHEWALKSKERRGTFSDKQTKYRKGNFFVGKRTAKQIHTELQ